MLLLLPVALVYGNEFGVYKAFSIIFMLNMTVTTYLINPSSFNIRTILLVMAGIFLFYGLLSSIWIYIVGYDFDERSVIVFNGPIVFGQYMIISCTIFLLYQSKIKALVAFLLSFLSQSKGPLFGGLLAFLFSSKNKVRSMLILLTFLVGTVVFLELDLRVFSWIFTLIDSGAISEVSSFSARIDAYQQSYRLVSQSFMGLGLGGWSDVSYLRYPHNIFLEILVELPLLLGICLILLMLFAFHSIKDSSYRILFIAILFMALFSGSIVDNRGVFFVTMLFLLHQGKLRV
jgi:hypothetical protein